MKYSIQGYVLMKSIDRSGNHYYFHKTSVINFSSFTDFDLADTQEAFCDPTPRTKHLKLPPNCVQKGTTNNVVDVGECPSVPCLQNDSDNSNACKDKTFCCGVSMVEELNIACGNVAELSSPRQKIVAVEFVTRPL